MALYQELKINEVTNDTKMTVRKFISIAIDNINNGIVKDNEKYFDLFNLVMHSGDVEIDITKFDEMLERIKNGEDEDVVMTGRIYDPMITVVKEYIGSVQMKKSDYEAECERNKEIGVIKNNTIVSSILEEVKQEDIDAIKSVEFSTKDSVDSINNSLHSILLNKDKLSINEIATSMQIGCKLENDNKEIENIVLLKNIFTNNAYTYRVCKAALLSILELSPEDINLLESIMKLVEFPKDIETKVNEKYEKISFDEFLSKLKSKENQQDVSSKIAVANTLKSSEIVKNTMTLNNENPYLNYLKNTTTEDEYTLQRKTEEEFAYQEQLRQQAMYQEQLRQQAMYQEQLRQQAMYQEQLKFQSLYHQPEISENNEDTTDIILSNDDVLYAYGELLKDEKQSTFLEDLDKLIPDDFIYNDDNKERIQDIISYMQNQFNTASQTGKRFAALQYNILNNYEYNYRVLKEAISKIIGVDSPKVSSYIKMISSVEIDNETLSDIRYLEKLSINELMVQVNLLSKQMEEEDKLKNNNDDIIEESNEVVEDATIEESNEVVEDATIEESNEVVEDATIEESNEVVEEETAQEESNEVVKEENSLESFEDYTKRIYPDFNLDELSETTMADIKQEYAEYINGIKINQIKNRSIIQENAIEKLAEDNKPAKKNSKKSNKKKK